MKRLLFVILIGLFVFVPTVVLGTQFRSGNSVQLAEDVSEDLYAGGNDVSSTKKVNGDAFLFGNTVTVKGEITEDLALGAAVANIEGIIGDDLRFGAGSARLNGQVKGDVFGGASVFALSPDSIVSGGMYLGGSQITLDGVIKGDVRVAADSVVINGTLERDAQITAKKLELGPKAKVHNIAYKGDRQAVVDPAAQVEGTITFDKWRRGGLNDLRPLALLYNALTWILLGFVVLMLLKIWAPRFTEEVKIEPFPNALIGLAGIIFVPIAMLILTLTILGAPVALVLGMFAALAGVVGSIIGIRWIGKLFMRPGTKHTEELGAYALAVVVLTLVGILPVIGAAATFVIFLIGFGTVIRYLLNSFSRKGRAH